MISVLIPVLNYDVSKLIRQLQNLLLESAVDFEIIFIEDGSDKINVITNQSLENLSHVRQIVSNHNLGRVKARQRLTDEAKYEILLFMDADVFPKSDAYIKNYLTCADQPFEAVFGGICYHNTKPQKPFILRWKYGILHEQTKAEKRNRNKYKQIVSANMLIRKSTIKSINSEMKSDGYGLDNYLSAILKKKKIKIKHIDNEVFHLGLDSNKDFLEKTRQAVRNLLSIYNEGSINDSDNTLLNYFKSVKRYKINFIIARIFRLSKGMLEKNLLGDAPSINLFQFYKLGYICHLDLRK